MKIGNWKIIKCSTLEELENNLSQETAETHRLTDQLKKCRDQLKTENDIDRLKRRKIQIGTEIEKQQKEIGTLKVDLTDNSIAVMQKKSEVSDLNDRIHALKLEFKAKDKALKELNEEAGQIEIRRQELSNDDAQLISDIRTYETKKKENDTAQDELREKMAEIVKQSSTISNMEDVEDKLSSLKQDTDNLLKEKVKTQGLIKDLNTSRGEHGIISALEFEIEKGEVSENWIKLFSVILDSKMNTERKNRIMLHLSARLDAADSYRINLDDTAYSEPAEKLLLLIQKYKNETSGDKVTLDQIANVLEELSGKVEFSLGQEAPLL